MEQGNGQDELVDLSGALDNNNPAYDGEDVTTNVSVSENKMPGLYGLVGKLTGGVIKTEKQAKAILIILIILMNVVTFSLLLKENNKTAPVTSEAIPAQAE